MGPLGWMTATVAIMLVAGLVHWLIGPDGVAVPPKVIEAGPIDIEVPRMKPISITFIGSVDQGRIQNALSVSPAVPGDISWKKKGENRILQLQPRWPGYARGTTYTVRIGGGKPEKGELHQPLDFIFTTEGKLKVQNVIPAADSTEVDTEAIVLVEFSRPVAPLTVLEQPLTGEVLRFDPPIAGKGKWLTSTDYIFSPTQGLAPSTRYTVTVPKTVSGALGGSLEEDFTWAFTTILPAAVAPFPADSSLFVDPAVEVKVTFNQAMDKASAEAHFMLVGPKSTLVEGSFSWLDDLTLIFRPRQPLSLSSRYDARLEKGASAFGHPDITTTSDTSWGFTTVGPPTVQSTNPRQGDKEAAQFGAEILFSNPMDTDSVEKAISLLPKPEEGDLRFFWQPTVTASRPGAPPPDQRLRISFTTRPFSPYTITIGPDAKDRYSQPLQGAPFRLTYTTAPARPSFAIARSGTAAIFNAYDQPRVRISAINISRLDFEILAIDLPTFINTEAKTGQTLPQAPVLRRWSVDIPNPPLNNTVAKDVPLQGQDGGAIGPGYYLLRVTSPQVSREPPYQMLIVVTKTHLTLKRSDKEVLIWAVDMASGKPMADLPLTIYDSNSQRRSSGRTDKDGIFVAPMDRPEIGSSEQFYVVAERQEDSSIVSNRWSQGFSPFDFQLSANFNRRAWAGYVYTDRPIYRPGQTVYYKGILRSDDDAAYSTPPTTLSFVVITNDAMGRLVERRTVKLSDMGTFDGKLDLNTQTSIGFYQIAVYPEDAVPEYSPEGKIVPKGRFISPATSVSFQVAEYRKPEFEVNVTADKPEYVQGEPITASLEARYFFGQPVANADVRWSITARPYFFNWPEEPFYRFNDLDLVYGQQRPPEFRVRKEEIGKTDSQGKLSLTLNADVSTDPLSQIFVVDATVTDANQQQVSGNTEAIIHKGAFYIGLQPQRYVARAGEAATVDVVTLNPQRRTEGNIPLTVSIYQRRWLSVRERQPDGSFIWRSVPQDTLVETRTLTTGADGKGSLTYTPSNGGTYRLVAEGHDAQGNTIRSAVFQWISSSEFVNWRMTNDNRLELRPDKDQYKPGETAHILVTASFEDSLGLVTLERGTIMSRQVTAFPTNSTVIDVPITDRHIPNIYISVALFKGATPDNPVPSFRLGYAELKVATDEKVINISIQPDKEKTEPRQKETYTINTTDAQGKPVAAELSLALVDKAVLTLAEDRAPKPLRAFWSTRPLGVQTAAAYALSIDRLLQITPLPPAGEGKGGGGGGGIPSEEVRRLFPDTAYWNPTLRTDASGRATVTVDLPDTLTTWRLTAKGVNQATQVGDATNDIITSKSLIVRPAIPRFLVTGDSAHLETSIHNFSGKPQQIQVTLKAQGLQVIDSTPRQVSIPPGESRQVAWDTKVPQGEKAVLTFEATSAGLSDAVELTLPVYTYNTPEVVATAGQVVDEPITEIVHVPGWVQKDSGELKLELSPSLAAALNYSLQQVETYPYEDVGTTVSRLIPRLALNRAIGKLGLPDTLGIKGKLPGLVANSLQRLYQCQQFDGGWTWTCFKATASLGLPGGIGTPGSNPEITAYALLGMAEAKQDNLGVDSTVMKRASDFLRNWIGLGRDVARPLDPNTRAFVLYALAAAGQGDLGLTNALVQERKTLGNYGKAYLALTIMTLSGNQNDLQLKALLSDLTASAIASSTGTHWEDEPGNRRTLNTSTRSTAIVLLALLRSSPNNPLIDSTVRWLMVARREGQWATTQETTWSLLALTEYLDISGELKADYSYQVRMNDKLRSEKKVDAANRTQPETVIASVKDLLFDEDNRIGIVRSPASAPGRLYYTLSLRYFPPGDDLEAINNGIGIGREYSPVGGSESITSATAGALVQVRVTVVAPTDLHYVVVEDYLPAGLEPIDTSLKTTSQATRLMLQQLREALQPQKTRRWFYFNPFEHVEMRDNRVVLFATFLPKGISQYVYLARAKTPGEFRVIPARAAETYFPEVWGRSDGATFTITP